MELHPEADTSTPKRTLGGHTAANSQFVYPRSERHKDESAQSYNTLQEKASKEVENAKRLKNIDPDMIKLIKNEIVHSGETVTWDDVVGLESIKNVIKEVMLLPMLWPNIFKSLYRPPKGILLFGLPGTGKTFIGKYIASQIQSTFFFISASSLRCSKWMDNNEKMVHALFARPSVIFIDEIDSLLTQRSKTEHESSRRLKTEFLVQMDGVSTSESDRILIFGTTSRPQDLDEAARRRFVKRLYVPLPDLKARKQIITNLLKSVDHDLNEEDIATIAGKTVGYSGADMTDLCTEASMGPVRTLISSNPLEDTMEEMRNITTRDFEKALINVRPSTSRSNLNVYIEWDRLYGFWYPSAPALQLDLM
ncbi:PREDICTED: fidgetin-like protein 1 [Wasmannia auropunctata]|uniref:fidgetin-like protein 1 n=1 Tax=Wasmannia auropunctata TaxID=64793 RepID=UPI0005F060F0|nr:PREDICTED: fidgetin-like protein 1 [Wasmannia auropunctata]